MKIFIDTSAFFAVLDKDDEHHPKAKHAWRNVLEQENTLVTSNYVLVECFALIQNRLGLEAAQAFQEDIIPLLHIEFVDSTTHKSGVSAMLAASCRKLSLVDCVSFEVIRAFGIKRVFAFAPHFKEQGFHCI